MMANPCDKFDYNSNDYKSCVKDIVFEQAQDEWIMLDPRFPNIKGITPKRIDEFLANAEKDDMKEYFEDYLQHVMVYDRDDIYKMCVQLGEQIDKSEPDALHSPHSIFVTTPRGGHEVLSIFAYANDLDKEQMPSNIRGIGKEEYILAQKKITREEESYECDENEYDTENDEDNEDEDEYYGGYYPFYEEEELAIDIDMDDQSVIDHYNKGNYQTIPDIWLPTDTFYLKNHILRVFIIDDIIASGDQMLNVMLKIERFFKGKTEIAVQIIPVVLVKQKNNDIPAIYAVETIGLTEWEIARDSLKKDYDSLNTVRFPWGSPDGESDKILTTLYEGRRGLDRIERKKDMCILQPKHCELK